MTAWRKLAASPLGGRLGHAAVWTGTELLVWGGMAFAPDDRTFADGGAYDPKNDAWRPMAASPLSARSSPVAAWTGKEMLVWDGDGAAYDPAADRWRTLAPSPLSKRFEPAYAWTGDRLLVWGGKRDRGEREAPEYFADGAAYDPAADRWTPLAKTPLHARAHAAAVWTGSRFIVWGGGWAEGPLEGEVSVSEMFRDGASYDPKANSWKPITQGPETSDPAYGEYSAVWTGSRMLVWPGKDQIHVYDPARDVWKTGSRPPLTQYRYGQSEVWTGERMIVWGGQCGEGCNHNWADGASYDPDEDAWSSLPPSSLMHRFDHSAVWTGTEMLVWGGSAEDWRGGDPVSARPSEPPDYVTASDGAAYRP